PQQAQHPARIGRYEVERFLGPRDMFMVYLAQDPHVKRHVAIKLLSSQFTADPAFHTRFRREAELIAALEHPTIVQVYDFGQHEERPFVVMQYLPGGTLAIRLSAGPLELRDLTPAIERVAEALDMAHARQIIHRDIKPANILFDAYRQAFLSDFSIPV